MSLVCLELVSSDAGDWDSSKNWKCGLYLYSEVLWGLEKSRTDSVSLLIDRGATWQSGPCFPTHTVCAQCVLMTHQGGFTKRTENTEPHEDEVGVLYSPDWQVTTTVVKCQSWILSFGENVSSPCLMKKTALEICIKEPRSTERGQEVI